MDTCDGLCHVFVQADGMPWQMLLPYDVVVDFKTTEADVITSSLAKRQMLLPYAWHVADGKPEVACYTIWFMA